MTLEQARGTFHGYQMTARHQFGLQQGNVALLRSCGSETIVIEECLLIILEESWRLLRRRR